VESEESGEGDEGEGERGWEEVLEEEEVLAFFLFVATFGSSSFFLVTFLGADTFLISPSPGTFLLVTSFLAPATASFLAWMEDGDGVGDVVDPVTSLFLFPATLVGPGRVAVVCCDCVEDEEEEDGGNG
jgi:hypothetical protein